MKITPESLPLVNGKVMNEARKRAGKVLRHGPDCGPSHGCVEVGNVLTNLAYLIAERNRLETELTQLRARAERAEGELDRCSEKMVKTATLLVELVNLRAENAELRAKLNPAETKGTQRNTTEDSGK